MEKSDLIMMDNWTASFAEGFEIVPVAMTPLSIVAAGPCTPRIFIYLSFP
jgi:hypothetical protein